MHKHVPIGIPSEDGQYAVSCPELAERGAGRTLVNAPGLGYTLLVHQLGRNYITDLETGRAKRSTILSPAWSICGIPAACLAWPNAVPGRSWLTGDLHSGTDHPWVESRIRQSRLGERRCRSLSLDTVPTWPTSILLVDRRAAGPWQSKC